MNMRECTGSLSERLALTSQTTRLKVQALMATVE